MSEFKMPDLSNLMQAAQKIQGDVAQMQEELSRMKCEASAGGGMVTAVVNGHNELTSLSIDRDVVDPDDVSMLEDLIRAAVNQALDKMRETAKSEMAKITGGLDIPGLTGMP
ncbi:MAG TPA: YbaB/EbfC family nucleoid-associated protein [Kofleriaceae bacterium]|nr:YbaB/EbfC family nucleoid-associated protein [Kofleriaceae bacterium]